MFASGLTNIVLPMALFAGATGRVMTFLKLRLVILAMIAWVSHRGIASTAVARFCPCSQFT